MFWKINSEMFWYIFVTDNLQKLAVYILETVSFSGDVSISWTTKEVAGYLSTLTLV